MSQFDPEHWQERAEEARTLAEQMSDANAREKMLQIASSYERMAARARTASPSEQRQPGTAKNETVARRRVLVVDDNEADRYATTRIIKDAGFAVVEAGDYREALRILDDGNPLALLVLDVVLPSVTGFALARMARMQRGDLKTIYVTAYDLPSGEAGGPVLRKPVVPEQLLMHLRGELGS